MEYLNLSSAQQAQASGNLALTEVLIQSLRPITTTPMTAS